MRWMDRLARFFMGRYGMDSLYTALTVVSLVLMVVNLFIGSLLITLLVFGLLIWSMFRSLSRNIPARQRENQRFVKLWKKITFGKGPVRNYTPYRGYNAGSTDGYSNAYSGFGSAPPKKKKKPRLKTDKEHCFRTCPECLANLRLPKKKGAHTVVCPRCQCRFEVKI